MLTKLMADIKTAMREKDSVKLTALRGIKCEADRIAKLTTRETTTEDVESAVLKGIKQRNESIALYVQGGREDLADKERIELAILNEFLPEQLDEETIVKIVNEVIASVGAATKKDMGKVMAAINGKIAKGSADMKLISKLVGGKLI